MIIQLLAHAGEVHETVVEAAKHTAQDPRVLWLVLMLSPILIALITNYLLKLKLSTTLLSIGFFLIGFSVYSYQSPGIYTVVSLVGGFAMVFALTFFGLTAKE